MQIRRVLAALVLVAALGACTGPPTTSTPDPTEAPPVDVAPTKGSGQVEEPQPQGQAEPVLTTAVAGTGSAASVEAGVACIFWSWGGDGTPQLAEGVAFAIDGAVVDPATWSLYPQACTGNPARACVGATITADDTGCIVGFRRDSGPTPVEGARALVGMRGALTCTDPATTADCEDLAAQLEGVPDVSSALDLESFPVTNGDG